MRNIRIKILDTNYIVVIADTERFGEDEIVFEGSTFDECLLYIARETGKEYFLIRAYILDKTYMGGAKEGFGLPVEMYVSD